VLVMLKRNINVYCLDWKWRAKITEVWLHLTNLCECQYSFWIISRSVADKCWSIFFYFQLSHLERKWQQHEQNNFVMKDCILLSLHMYFFWIELVFSLDLHLVLRTCQRIIQAGYIPVRKGNTKLFRQQWMTSTVIFPYSCTLLVLLKVSEV
jgi:hypothetical protein